MKRITRAVLLALTAGIGLIAIVLTMAGLSVVSADGLPELTIDMNAPDHIAPGSTFVVNLAYANTGDAVAPDTVITATLPQETLFITATDPWGEPLPPDVVNGNVLVWNMGSVPTTTGPCCHHILIVEQADENLAERTVLTHTASIATSAVEPDLMNATATATSIVCEMAGSFKHVHAGEALPGDVLTYTIALNLARRPGGGIQERMITLTDTLPFSHQVRFLGRTGDVTDTQYDGQLLRWQGRVRAGEPLSLQYRLGVEGVITPSAVITNMAQLGWSVGHMQLGPVTTVITLPHGALALGPHQGGELRHEYGVTLTVPRGTVTDTTRFQFRPLFTDTQVISGPPGVMFAHRAFELTAFRFGQDVRQFGRPLTITLHYSDAHVAGLKRETLHLWTRSGPDEPWAMLGDPVRVMSGTLAFTTTHFSQFALFGEGAYRAYLPAVFR